MQRTRTWSLATGTAAGRRHLSHLRPQHQNLSPDGVYNLIVTASDIAGNVSTSSNLALTIDTTSPGTPPAPQLDPGSRSTALTYDDSITNVKTLFLIDLAATEKPRRHHRSSSARSRATPTPSTSRSARSPGAARSRTPGRSHCPTARMSTRPSRPTPAATSAPSARPSPSPSTPPRRSPLRCPSSIASATRGPSAMASPT